MAPHKLFVHLLAIAAVLAVASVAVAAKKPPATHLHFYMHDIITSSSPTAVKVISTSGPNPLFNFGDTVVIDDPLTEGPNLTASKLVGRAQGFYTLTSLGPADGLALLLTVNLVFTEGRYNGSTLAVLGRDDIALAVRELPVVGGSGKFRMAGGYVLVKTYSLNMTTGNAVLEWDVYVTKCRDWSRRSWRTKAFLCTPSFGLIPAASNIEVFPLNYSKSYSFNLVVGDKSHLRRAAFVSASLIVIVAAVVTLLLVLLPRKHSADSPSGLELALDSALLFFDAQKSGILPENNPVKFRGDSGLQDGHWDQINTSLVGGFYDAGSNIKFSFTTAYTTTLLSWTAIEYGPKYSALAQLEHVKDIIKWGSDYLLKLFASDYLHLFSQVGSGNGDAKSENDVRCWQRPEDMEYQRPVFTCGIAASDLAGEVAAALAAASLVFQQDDDAYSKRLVHASQILFDAATSSRAQRSYAEDRDCGAEAANLYNSTSYRDELVWGATWLFFATGNYTYLRYASQNFEAAVEEEPPSDAGTFYWNNKVAANAMLLTRLRFLKDPGYPYEPTLKLSSDMVNSIICSYLAMPKTFSMTADGLILFQNNSGAAPILLAATAAFLSKIYNDYLEIVNVKLGICGADIFSLNELQSFARSQVNYILGDNPLRTSYLVGFGDKYPEHVHHRAASIPWDGKKRTCAEGTRWRDAKEPNPNVLVGGMVAGPDQDEGFLDIRNRREYTEPSISGNAGLVAALVSLIDVDEEDAGLNWARIGMDRDKMFAKIS